MALRQKSKRRMMWVAVSVVAVAAAGVGAVYLRSAQRERFAISERARGMKLLEAGDYPEALKAIYVYVQRHGKDPEALYAMATARRQVEEPEGKHLSAAMFFLRQVVDLDPARKEAAHDLLDLYVLTHLDPEATKLADSLLARDPDDATALRARSMVLAHGRKFEEALAAVEKRLKADPRDAEARLQLLENLANLKGLEAARARADADLAADGSDPARWLARGITAMLANDGKQSVADVTRAKELLGSRGLTDADYRLLQYVLRQLDSLGQPAPAIELAGRAADQGLTGMDAEAVRRLYYAGRNEEAVARATQPRPALAARAPGAPKPDPDAVSQEREYDPVRAMILCQLGEKEKARAVVATLGPAQKDWADAIAEMLSPTSSEQSLIPKLEDIARRRPNAPLFLMALGDAYERAGDSESAMRNWRMASLTAPSWGAPLLKLSRADLRLGRLQEAFDLARRARVVSPSSGDAAATAGTAWAEALRWHLTDNQGELLQFADEFQKDHPEDLRPKLLKARAYSAKGDGKRAQQALEGILAGGKAPPRDALLEAAAIAQDAGAAELNARLLGLAAKEYGQSPVLAAATARGAAESGDFAGALKTIEAARSRASDPNDVDWGLVYASMLERAGDPTAKDKWIAIADANKGSARVQWAAISSRAAQGDAEFMARAFDRLKELTGGQGISLKLARAAYAVERNKSKDDLQAAALSLGEVTRISPRLLAARLLLADALEKLGNMAGAVEQEAVAANIASGSVDVRLQLAALQQRAGNAERAREELRRAMALGTLTPVQSRYAANIAGRLNDPETAIKLLAAAGPSDRTDLEMAGYLRQQGQFEKVDALVPRLLASRNLGSIAFAADYLGARGKLAEGKAALAKLDGADAADPGLICLVRGDYYLKYDVASAAKEQFEAAIKASPKDARPWHRLMSVAVRSGNAEELLATARRASQAISGDAAAQALLAEGAALTANIKDLPYNALARGAIDAPADQLGAVREAMKIQASAAADPKVAAAKLKALADRVPRCLPVQTAAAMMAANTRRTEDAATIAKRAMDAFPYDATSAEIAAKSLRALGRDDEARIASQQWRQRMAGDPVDPDLLVGTIDLQGGLAGAAAERLEPHVAKALANPQQYAAVLLYYGRAKVVSNRGEEFAALVRPLLPTSAVARAVMCRLADSGGMSPTVAAAWLADVDAATPAKAFAERVALATALADVVSRRGPASAKTELDGIVVRLSDDGAAWDGVTAEALNGLGQLRERLGDFAGAEAAYRRALQLDPKNPVGNNNLAMILVRKGSALPEALDLASRAAAADPETDGYTNFVDTRATVLEGMKKFDDAIATMQLAVAREPQNSEWLIHLGSLQLQGGQKDKAKQTLAKVNDMAPRPETLSPDSTSRLQQLRSLGGK